MATLRGIFPNPKGPRRKNFIHENVKNLRRMEQYCHAKEVEEFQKPHLRQKSTCDGSGAGGRYQNIPPRIDSSLRNGKRTPELPATLKAPRHSDKNLRGEIRRVERKASAPLTGKVGESKTKSPTRTNVNAKRKTADDTRIMGRQEDARHDRAATELSRNPDPTRDSGAFIDGNEKDYIKYRHQGIQTMNTDDIDALYSEGVIRYPSSANWKKVASPAGRDDGEASHELRKESSPSPPPPPAQQSPLPRASAVCRADAGKSSQKAGVANKFATQLNNGVPPANYRKGVVPKYIRERREEQLQREEKLKAATAHPECPEGHVPLPDNERKETLRMLKKNYQEYVNELIMMPIKSDTLRSQKRKIEIEKQLNKLEEGIKTFSRPKVYIKVNA